MFKKNLITFLIAIILIFPHLVFAMMYDVNGLKLPENGNDSSGMMDFNPQSYVAVNVDSGQILISKNEDLQWSPASLTKLVTALVVLDTKPNLSKQVTMSKRDQIVGSCKSGGVCIKSATGVKFTVDGLFHAALMPSANNAASALAVSTGLSADDFVRKMNEKVVELGGFSSNFNEPTGLDPNNKITAADYSKILAAAFESPYLSQIANLQSYTLRSTNNSKYNQTIKNTDKLLSDSDMQILGAKTGYLKESQHNFAALIKNKTGQHIAIVVLGEQQLTSAFAETKLLASLADNSISLALGVPDPVALGTSTRITFNK